MRDQERLTRPVVVALLAQIDIGNAEHVRQRLRAASCPLLPPLLPTWASRSFAPSLAAVSWRRLIKDDELAHKPEPGIGNCHRSNQVGQNAQARCRAARRLVLTAGAACEPAL